MSSTHKAHIMILATGGTIAGVADETHTDYESGVLGIDTLLQDFPQIHSLAHIHTKQICNIDSADMSDDIWLTLAHNIKVILSDSLYDGIVITHGTDTMEESAFFLHLTTISDKPIILTGAMRPFNDALYDGGKNLFNAIKLAAYKDSQNRGVMVCMNGQIYSPLDVSKLHTLEIDAFSSKGGIGFVTDSSICFSSPLIARQRSIFHIENLKSLPRVDILYSYANDGSSIAAKALFESGTKGIVIAGSGAGSIHRAHKEMLKSLLKQGLVVVVSSRINQGSVHISKADSELGFISSAGLNPQKARVLLMLALSQSKDLAEIARIFQSLFNFHTF